MPTNRQRRRQPQREGNRLTPQVREILSGGMDFFDTLSHMEPIQKDRWGKIQRNLWVFVEGRYEPGPYDPPSWLPDGRLDFLRGEWAKHKTEILRWHIDRFRDRSRPWGWWAFGDAPEPHPLLHPADGSSEAWAAAREQQRLEAIAILIRHGLLTAAEEEKIRERAASEAALRASGPGNDSGFEAGPADRRPFHRLPRNRGRAAGSRSLA